MHLLLRRYAHGAQRISDMTHLATRACKGYRRIDAAQAAVADAEGKHRCRVSSGRCCQCYRHRRQRFKGQQRRWRQQHKWSGPAWQADSEAGGMLAACA